MANYRGDQLRLRWTHTGGSVLELIGKYRNFEVSEEVDTIDSSAGTAAGKSYIMGLDDVTMSYSFVPDDADGTAVNTILRAMYPTSFGTLSWGPWGTAAGDPKYECAAYITSVTQPNKYDDLPEHEVEFQRTGNWIAHFGRLGSVW